MTRKHYERLAQAFAGTMPNRNASDDHAQWYAQWSYDVQTVADVLATDNPKFDRARFVIACEGKVR